MERRQMAIEAAIKDGEDNDTQYCNSKQSGCAGNGIVDAGGGTGSVRIHGTHDCCGEWSDTYSHAYSQYHGRRKKGRPVAAPNTGQGKRAKTIAAMHGPTKSGSCA